MEASLTESKVPHMPVALKASSKSREEQDHSEYTKSTFILNRIYETLNSPSNYR